jgi:enamine deaminase RidA (YjgF/YER057c/UK114 family)
MRKIRLASLITVAAAIATAGLWPAPNSKQEERTQKLESLPEPPAAVTAETARLVFRVAPLSKKGLLSRQIRDGVKALLNSNRRARMVKLRAFVAGSGDARRVREVVSKLFADRRLPLPALSVVQVGALPVVGAQVALEAVVETRKAENPHGLAFISGQAATSEEPILEVAPLAIQSLRRLRTAITSLGLTPREVLRVTCFCSSLKDGNEVRRAMIAEFPSAARTYVQVQRAYTSGSVECEAVARLLKPAGEPLSFLNPEDLPKLPDRSQIALVGARRVAFSGTQLAFRYQDSDVRLAFERLGKSLEEVGTSYAGVAMSGIYPLTRVITEKIRTLRFEYYDKSRPPASTMLLFEGLPSLDASFAVDAVAIMPG